MEYKFKAGDKVKVIDNSFTWLDCQVIYEVKKTYENSGIVLVELLGYSERFIYSRFELVDNVYVGIDYATEYEPKQELTWEQRFWKSLKEE